MCGVADYMLRYFTGTDSDLQGLRDDLDSIANLTQGSQDTVVFMKDSVAAAQKSATPGNPACLRVLNLTPRISVIDEIIWALAIIVLLQIKPCTCVNI